MFDTQSLFWELHVASENRVMFESNHADAEFIVLRRIPLRSRVGCGKVHEVNELLEAVRFPPGSLGCAHLQRAFVLDLPVI